MKIELVKAVRLAVIGAIIVAVILIAVPLILQAIAQPNIVITETSMPERRFCSDVRTFSFTLVNTADADGFANIQFFLDGVEKANQDYFVPAELAEQREKDGAGSLTSFGPPSTQARCRGSRLTPGGE